MKSRILKVFSSVFFISLLIAALCFIQGCIFVDPFTGLLVSGDELEANLGSSGLVIIDARASSYNDVHIPGAISMIWGDYADENLNLKSLTELQNQLSAAGLSRDMIFVIYDDTTASWGAAGRVFWMLEYLGCDNVHILNGGWDKWIADGRSTETTTNTLPASIFIAEVNEDVLVDKNYILSRLSDDDFVIIDPREDEEYNGWTLYDESRGGHIPGAVQIPYKWFFKEDKTILDYQNLKDLLESRGITTDKEITSYCTAGIRSGFVYFILRMLGYTKCSNYDGAMYEWSADPTYPMDKMANYQMLVYPAWVEELIAGGNPGTAGTPPTYPGNGYVIVHASSLYWKGAADPNGYNPHEDYESGHIPGAISIPLNTFDTTVEGGIYPWTCPDDGNLLPADQLQTVIESYGITHDTTVVVYCGKKSYQGGAYRIAWALLYAGVDDVRYLNGDLPGWEANGGTLEATTNTPTPVDDFGITVPAHPEYYASTEQIKAMISDSGAVIGDDRSWTEYAAEDESGCYYDFFCAPGHIPNAVWVHDMSWYLDDFDTWHEPAAYAPGTLRSYTEVEREWLDLGLTPDKKIAFHCGGGWRSSLVWFFAHAMGYPSISNYDGGWYEWTWDPNNPIEIGEP